MPSYAQEPGTRSYYVRYKPTSQANWTAQPTAVSQSYRLSIANSGPTAPYNLQTLELFVPDNTAIKPIAIISDSIVNVLHTPQLSITNISVVPDPFAPEATFKIRAEWTQDAAIAGTIVWAVEYTYRKIDGTLVGPYSTTMTNDSGVIETASITAPELYDASLGYGDLLVTITGSVANTAISNQASDELIGVWGPAVTPPSLAPISITYFDGSLFSQIVVLIDQGDYTDPAIELECVVNFRNVNQTTLNEATCDSVTLTWDEFAYWDGFDYIPGFTGYVYTYQLGYIDSADTHDVYGTAVLSAIDNLVSPASSSELNFGSDYLYDHSC